MITKEDKIRKILQDAQDQILRVLKGEDEFLMEAASNIDATADKILRDSFEARTMLVDGNKIDMSRYRMLDYISDFEICEIFESCKKYVLDGCVIHLSETPVSKYLKLCSDLSKLLGTELGYELDNNVDMIIFKYKEINVNDTRLTDGEA
jgi:hypothetical protein